MLSQRALEYLRLPSKLSFAPEAIGKSVSNPHTETSGGNEWLPQFPDFLANQTKKNCGLPLQRRAGNAAGS